MNAVNDITYPHQAYEQQQLLALAKFMNKKSLLIELQVQDESARVVLVLSTDKFTCMYLDQRYALTELESHKLDAAKLLHAFLHYT
jgi:hypothetical protein